MNPFGRIVDRDTVAVSGQGGRVEDVKPECPFGRTLNVLNQLCFGLNGKWLDCDRFLSSPQIEVIVIKNNLKVRSDGLRRHPLLSEKQKMFEGFERHKLRSVCLGQKENPRIDYGPGRLPRDHLLR